MRTERNSGRIEQMNRIEFRVESEELGTGPADVLNLYVDGSRLQDLIRPYEQPFADAEGKPTLAGQYVGLIERGLSAKQFLNQPTQTWFGDGDTILLGCECGEAGCWPLTAHVEVGSHRVLWRHFRTGHRKWDLSAFGPFEFDRAKYDASLKQVFGQ
jgi:hypothetical protein